MRIFNKKKNDIIKSENIYIGRDSVCMADDVTAPNMSSFILTDNLEIFKNNICKCLPYIAADEIFIWNGSKGFFEQRSKNPNDICVHKNKDSTPLFSITINMQHHNVLDFQIKDNWYEIIKEYPYLFLVLEKHF
ncbi:MAG: hypothetical protein HFJ34_02505 [Clostridia bacterium]|nr:hypothetical protein [Clostridia bacterium]